MNESQKKEIQMLLKAFVERHPSQKKAADALRVADGTLIKIKSGDWNHISDDMWRNIGKQVGYNPKGGWKTVPTGPFNACMRTYDFAQEYSAVLAIVADAGKGKTAASLHYKNKRDNVYHIVCSEYFNRKVFLQKVLESMGKPDTGANVSDMMDRIVTTLRRQECPFIIIDEADKLTDAVLYFFITFYNQLQGKCGIALVGTEYLEQRILKGKRLRRKGYAEIYSRIGRKFSRLPDLTKQDIASICEANGVSDEGIVSRIYNECDNDLRRVERAVLKVKVAKVKKAA